MGRRWLRRVWCVARRSCYDRACLCVWYCAVSTVVAFVMCAGFCDTQCPCTYIYTYIRADIHTHTHTVRHSGVCRWGSPIHVAVVAHSLPHGTVRPRACVLLCHLPPPSVAAASGRRISTAAGRECSVRAFSVSIRLLDGANSNRPSAFCVSVYFFCPQDVGRTGDGELLVRVPRRFF